MKRVKSKLKTPISYYGGKQSLLKHLLPLIPEHLIYTETFAGGAALLFAKEEAEIEIINDLNSELVNFYWVATTKYDDLKVEIDQVLHSRDIHQHARYVYMNPLFFSDVKRAWAVWVLCKLSFASKLDGSFGFDKSKRTMSKKIGNAKEAFTLELSERLSRVVIEHDNALKMIKRYDTVDAFHFVDPPYINSDCGHYEGMFTHIDLMTLLELLAGIKGKFLLTMYPQEDIELYAQKHGWEIVAIERVISVSRTGRKKREEWLVMNY